jgi:hypothetical protein
VRGGGHGVELDPGFGGFPVSLRSGEVVFLHGLFQGVGIGGRAVPG